MQNKNPNNIQILIITFQHGLINENEEINLKSVLELSPAQRIKTGVDPLRPSFNPFTYRWHFPFHISTPDLKESFSVTIQAAADSQKLLGRNLKALSAQRLPPPPTAAAAAPTAAAAGPIAAQVPCSWMEMATPYRAVRHGFYHAVDHRERRPASPETVED